MASNFLDLGDVGVQILSPGALTPKTDFQERMVFVYVLFGSLRVKNPVIQWNLKKDDLVLIHSGIRYDMQSDDSESIIAWISLPHITTSLMKNGLLWCNSVADPDLDYSEIRRTLDLIISHYLELHGSDFKTLSLFYRLLYILKEEFFISANSDRYNKVLSLVDTRAIHIAAYIHNNFDAAPSLAELADEMGLSVPYLSRFISKNMGMTFSAYLNKARLEYTVGQLLTTNESVTKIAMDSGFSNLSSFNQSFQKQYKVSASEYRKHHSAEESIISGSTENIPENMLRRTRPDYFQNKVRLDLKATENLIIDADNCESESSLPEITIIDVGDLKSLKDTRHRQHLSVLKKRIDVKYARFYQVLTYPMEMGEYVSDYEQDYDYSIIDSCLDFLTQLGLKPYFCMQLTTNSMIDPYRSNERHAFHYNNLEELETVYRLLLHHEVNRYGYNEVSSWIFELAMPFRYVKTDPVIANHGGIYYNQIIYRVTKEILPDARIGAANFSLLFEDEEILTKITLLNKAGIRPDFVSCISFPYKFRDVHETSVSQRRWVISPDFHKREINHFQKLLSQTSWNSLPIVVTEFGPSSDHRNSINDTRLRGSYMINAYLTLINKVKSIGLYWLSDVTEAGRGTGTFLFGGFGLIQRKGILKASFFAFEFLSKLKKTVVMRNENSILTRDDEGNFVLVAENMQLSNLGSIYQKEELMGRKDLHQLLDGNHSKVLSYRIQNLASGIYQVHTSIVSDDFGDIDSWVEHNNLSSLSSQEIDDLRSATLPRMTITEQAVDKGRPLSIQLSLGSNDFACVQIRKAETANK